VYRVREPASEFVMRGRGPRASAVPEPAGARGSK
jgi:hypothetical protein